jgi:beta-lactamase regulating signal transducer with metallopeptidase domain
MDNMSIFRWMNEDMVTAIVQTIFHSLWMFAVIALIMSVLLKRYQNAAAAIRYKIALGSLFVSVFVFVLSLIYFYPGEQQEVIVNIQAGIFENDASGDGNIYSILDRLQIFMEQYRWPLAITWVLGVLLFGIRLIGSLIYVQLLSKRSIPINIMDINQVFEKVCAHFKINTSILIKESKDISTPMILGILKPVILFPVGMLNQLSMAETEAILAHELAHFGRKDIIVNIIQTIIEALLYYHPAIWWISANIRVERENCCDEQAIAYAGNRIQYAKTLVKIQEIQHGAPMLALQFAHKSFFSNRIKRILNMTQTRNFLKEKVITTFIVLGMIFFVSKDLSGSYSPNNSDHSNSTDGIQKTVTITVDTIPFQKESIRIQKRTNDQDVKISIENGDVVELEINGEKIDKADYDKYEDIIAESKPRSSGNGNARMFFFDDGEPQSFGFNFGDEKFFADSLLKNFEGFRNFEGLGNLEGLRGLKGLEGLRSLEGLEGLQSLDMSQFAEQMKKMQEQLGGMHFDFRSLDSLKGMDGFHFDFAFPDMKPFKGGIDVEDGLFDGALDDTDMPKINESYADIIGNALNRDGLLIPNESNKVELTGKHLKINGEKQPGNIYQKYRRIFEEESGTTLQKNSRLQFNIEGKVAKRKYRVY